jgi:hypothetical protein
LSAWVVGFVSVFSRLTTTGVMQAQNEMALLKAHADKEQAQFETEWRELGRVLEQDRRLKERMAGQDRGKNNTCSASCSSFL